VSRRDGPETLRTFEGREIVVGRLLSADVKIALGPVSRRHLVFTARDRGFAVRCGGRRVATRRNGQPFRYQALETVAAGDVFEVGTWRIEVVFAGDAGLAGWIELVRRDGGARSALLRVDRAGSASEWHEARAPKTSIGRSARADITIPGAYVARTHVVLECRGRDWSATHRGRLVSTRVNGSRLEPGATAGLVHGATILVADTRIVVCLSGRRPDLRWDEPFTTETYSEREPSVTATVEPLDDEHTAESRTVTSSRRPTRIEPLKGPTVTPTPSSRPRDGTEEMFDDESGGPAPFKPGQGDSTR
jgi:pSer/pThr/pTyr-binding forkhead associated (FHA) protein